MSKHKDVSFIREDGVKVTICAPRVPKKAERTWTAEKSKHSVWTQGRKGYLMGIRGSYGTVEK